MITIKTNNVKIYTTHNGGRDGKGERHEVRWTDHNGVIHRVKHSLLSKAEKEAGTIAANLRRGHHEAELTMADLGSFRAAVTSLYRCGGKTLEMAAGEYAESHHILKKGLERQPGTPMPSLKELAEFWLAHRDAALVDMDVRKAVDTLLEAKKGQGIGDRWYGSIKSQLNKFATAHPVMLSGIDAALVRRWVYGLPLAATTKNNHLNAVKLLFHQPELRAHRARQGILDIPEVTEGETDKSLWTPEEFRKLLNAAPAHLLPVLVLGGFAKMRSCEIMRVQTANIHLKDKRLLLPVGQGKVKKRWRFVPLPACAVAWLKTCDLSGEKVWPWESQKYNADLRGLAEACGLKWKPNAMRRSATTYDHVLNPDLTRVAREAGNSPMVLEQHYLALLGVTKQVARAWFKLVPPPRTGKAEILPIPVAGAT